jgi:hypothetical protein
MLTTSKIESAVALLLLMLIIPVVCILWGVIGMKAVQRPERTVNSGDDELSDEESEVWKHLENQFKKR